MLDFGTGPGTGIYAMHQLYPECQEVMAVEPSNEMMNIGMKLLEDTGLNINWRRFLNENMNRKFDIITASYVLNEIQKSTDRLRIIQSLWKLSNGVLIFIEPGTPLGFQLIKEARSTLLNHIGEKEDDVSILGPV
jgi:ribosomal protein RSM22 (predicted rRNA methylase)